MGKNVAVIILISLFTTAAWIILGTSVVVRSTSADTGLSKGVKSNWGAPQQQSPPSLFATTATTMSLPIEQSRIRVALDLEQRRKGLLWFATYRVAFHGDYVLRNSTPSDQVTVKLVFPAPDAIYDDLIVRADGQPIVLTAENGAVSGV